MDTLRFFAFGGTKYSLRNQIGAWPAISTSQTQSMSALDPAGNLSFGCGALGGEAFLIVRQLQHADDRGGVPYTVLLAPTERHWLRFGWDAAALLASILADPTARALVLDEPESADADGLHAVLDGLAPPATRPVPDGHPAPLLALWHAAAFFEKPVTASPQGLAGKGAIDPKGLAALLTHLPPAIRLGSGWLIGGDRGLADAFGAALLVDANAATSASDADVRALESSTQAGSELFEAWSALDKDPSIGSQLRRLGSRPTWRWPYRPSKVACSILNLHRLRTADRRAAAQVSELWTLDSAEPFARELRRAALVRMQHSVGAMHPATMDAILDSALRRYEDLTSDELALLQGVTRERLERGPLRPDLFLHYALFGDDPGGEWLVSRGLVPVGSLFFDLLLAARDSLGDVQRQCVDEWLEAAAQTTLLSSLQVDSKISAGHAGVVGFETYVSIAALLRGVRPPSPVRLSPAEKKRLAKDLDVLVARVQPTDPQPAFDDLKGVLEKSALNQLRDRFQAGAGHSSRGVLSCVALDPDGRRLQELLRSRIEDETAFVADLRDEIREVAEDKRLGAKLAICLQTSMKTLESLFSDLSEREQERLIAAIAAPPDSFIYILEAASVAYTEARRDLQRFGGLRSLLWKFHRQTEPPMPPRVRAAILRFLQSASPELRDAVGQRVLGKASQSNIESELLRLLPPASGTQ